ncbi:MAG: hypothetical protein WAO76_15245 [Georgfuchsia sp.]
MNFFAGSWLGLCFSLVQYCHVSAKGFMRHAVLPAGLDALEATSALASLGHQLALLFNRMMLDAMVTAGCWGH